MFPVGSLLRTNRTSSLVGQGEPEGTSGSGLQVVRENYHLIVNSPLQFQTQPWKWDVAAKSGVKTLESLAAEIGG